jgi:hypothetical protein
MTLLRSGLITEEEALKNCNNPNELSLKLKGISATSDRLWQPVEGGSEDAEASPALGRGRPGEVFHE